MRCEKPLTKTSKPYKLTTTPEARKDSHHTYHRDCSFFSNLLILDNFFLIKRPYLRYKKGELTTKPTYVNTQLLCYFVYMLEKTKRNIFKIIHYTNT